MTTNSNKETETKTGFSIDKTRIQHTLKLRQHLTLTKTRKLFPTNKKTKMRPNQTTKNLHSDQQKQVSIETVTTVANLDTWPKTADQEKV